MRSHVTATRTEVLHLKTYVEGVLAELLQIHARSWSFTAGSSRPNEAPQLTRRPFGARQFLQPPADRCLAFAATFLDSPASVGRDWVVRPDGRMVRALEESSE